ncbi:MAG: TIGR00268 family protein [Candidatus Omnitrophica bacterium CG11_big_fil_rev_8_21_14_0_20_42_13]|uniref:TIGR00268 family protein n=1 Tax=Candidatus Ghiorseimicrobium undicola TaxID=1974746 RepID=A0A2H0LX33_9BACT|nr:MAG: TIGR00268 family protein [Candidatus Omnitrophica bacterium CG11_big_fil_rev_8_21_14_0_20_42_13]
MRSVLAAYSGGVDSSFLLKVTHDMLGNNLLAVIAKSPTYTKSELKEAAGFCRKYKIKYLVIETDELNNPRFAKNPKNRCFYCKDELFSKLKQIARKKGLNCVIDGSNADDATDYRPGAKAKEKHGIRSPLQEAGLTKEGIRKLSKEMGLSVWNKPSLACLASRFPYNSRITKKDLKRINSAEEFLRGLGFKQVRVRHYNGLARIELPKDDIDTVLLTVSQKIVNKFKKLGYNYITLDLEGYRSGSMNETFNK